MLDRRSAALLERLLLADRPISVAEMSRWFGISRRTLYYDLEKINAWLRFHNLDPVTRGLNRGLYLPETTRTRLGELLPRGSGALYTYAGDERQAGVGLLLALEPGVTVDAVAERLQVSRGTVFNDLKHLRSALAQRGISLRYEKAVGYTFHGSESAFRSWLVEAILALLAVQASHPLASLLQSWLQQPQGAGEGSLWDELQQAVWPEVERVLQVRFSDAALLMLSAAVWVSARRVSSGHFLEEEVPLGIIQGLSEYDSALQVARRLESRYGLPMSSAKEAAFLAALLVTADRVEMDRVGRREESSFLSQLRAVAARMVNDLQAWGVLFLDDTESAADAVYEGLRALYFRLRFRVPAQRLPYFGVALQRLKPLYTLTRQVVKHLEALVEEAIPERELTGLTILLSRLIKRSDAAPVKRWKALVVCPQGTTTAQLLRNELEDLFQNIDVEAVLSLRDVGAASHRADLIFSTVPIEGAKRPVFILQPFLNAHAKAELLRKVRAELFGKRASDRAVLDLTNLIAKYAEIRDPQGLSRELRRYMSQNLGAPMVKEVHAPALAELLTAETVRLLPSVVGWEAAIREAARPLLDNASITARYIEAMIDNVKRLGPYVVVHPKVAIPHASPEDGVNRVGMSLLRLNQGVRFSSRIEEVKVVIVLASIDHESHLRALSQLSQLLGSEENIRFLEEADRVSDIMELVANFPQR